ncbi:SURF1 family protein [Polymorphobacter sp.]|uniref:SURF1 family protein n=1 Tax=Polymorphobacter sp. TaxID=1909290 RepID=UPI003F7027D6
MRRLPVVPSLIVFLLAAFLVGLGVWQLERREWKRQLILAAEVAPQLPPLGPADYVASMTGRASVQYRRAEMVCRPGPVRPYDLRGGSSADGQSGFLVLVSCRPDQSLAPDIVVVAGWTRRPDIGGLTLDVDAMFKGLIIERPYGDAPGRPQFMLIPDTAAPPLSPSRMPTPGDLPDNHLAYAGQWFGLAAALLVIYALWLRRRTRARADTAKVAAGDAAG